MISTHIINVASSDQVPDFINITDQIKELVAKSGVTQGQVLVYSQHTTAAIAIQENEKGIFLDVKDTLDLVAAKTKEYQHHIAAKDIPDEPLNGYAHCHHIFIGPSEIVPIFDGQMMLGTYQHIYLVELDRARSRNVVVQISGE